MKLKTVCQVLREVLSLGLVAQLMVGPPPAAAASPLSCSVTPQPDGSFRYQVSQPPRSSRCETLWERENRTVLALNSRFVPHLVQNLTEQSITLRDCLDFLYYRVDCPPVGVEDLTDQTQRHQTEAESGELQPLLTPGFSPTRRLKDVIYRHEEKCLCWSCWSFTTFMTHLPLSSLSECAVVTFDPRLCLSGNCFFGSWCPDELTAALLIGAPAAAIVLALIICFVVSKHRNRTRAVTLTASYTSVNEQVEEGGSSQPAPPRSSSTLTHSLCVNRCLDLVNPDHCDPHLHLHTHQSDARSPVVRTRRSSSTLRLRSELMRKVEVVMEGADQSVCDLTSDHDPEEPGL
ncbi:uncharacterized protein AKAME5_002030300 [Lates japonicus]|uniref:Uncharacterized protein n=1 Tax=Lates japonicus TaxID=270547 RepID=A0AAD3NCF2_LATJO|nr:uncharacterized protein AKAME5_002030300 [Lates japonicus]